MMRSVRKELSAFQYIILCGRKTFYDMYIAQYSMCVHLQISFIRYETKKVRKSKAIQSLLLWIQHTAGLHFLAKL